MHRSAEEIAEIERHKYFLSEKQGQDVGWEFAERDWEHHHGEQWRREQRKSAAAPRQTSGTATACCQETKAMGNGCDREGVPSEVHQAVIRKDAAGGSSERGALRRFLSRLFQQP